MDPNDMLAIQILQQGMKNIAESRANKDRDFMAFQTAILAGDNVVYQPVGEPPEIAGGQP